MEQDSLVYRQEDIKHQPSDCLNSLRSRLLFALVSSHRRRVRLDHHDVSKSPQSDIVERIQEIEAVDLHEKDNRRSASRPIKASYGV